MEHPIILANKLRAEGASYREIAARLNQEGYLTSTRRIFGQSSAWTLMKVGKKANYEIRGSGPVAPPKTRKNKVLRTTYKKSTTPMAERKVDTTMLIDVATSNLAEPTKAIVIQLLARSL